ncbi:YbaB/EbfC family nucleoid-associated protein [Fructilactobacillus cliffordii]
MAMNGMNMGKLMKQAQDMQRKMSAQQAEIDQQEFTGKAPDDLVVATFTGDRKMKDLQIKKEALDPDDPDMISDLTIAAVNDALKQIDETTKNKMGQFTQGMNIPGL